MVITSHGQGTIRIHSGDTALLVDPTSARLKADAVVHTASDISETPTPAKDVITFAGEYEAAGIDIRGFQCGADEQQVTTAYVIDWDGIRVLVVGDHAALPSGEALEEIGELQPQVVILPMATAEQAGWASKLSRSLEASLVLPTTFASKKEVEGAFGETAESEERVTFKKKDLAGMSQKLVLLSPAA